MRRRQILQGALCGALHPLTACSGPPQDSEPSPSAAPLPTPLTTVGLQLYTVRELLQQDANGTLAAIAALGYREVEFAGYFATPASTWRSTLDALGLVAPAAHFHIDVFQTIFAATLENALTLGHQHLVLPFVPHELRTPDGYREIAEVLNSTGAMAAQNGVKVGFHNHDFDFTPLEPTGERGFDILLAELDPALVGLELDFYWIALSGQSALSYLQNNPGRFPLCHLKDMTRLYAMADVGYGTLDWPTLIGAARQAGVQHYFVEHDEPSDALASARRSVHYLNGS